MKRIKNLSKLMLAVMTMLVMVACGGSDDNKSSEYTSEDIVKLLTGKWTISGDVLLTETETGNKMEGNYTGTLNFKENQSIESYVKANCTHSDFSENDLSWIINFHFLYNKYKYSVAKKNGKDYISIKGVTNSYDFEIISLDKTTMRLVLEGDYTRLLDDKKNTHVFMTVNSK